MKAYHGTSVGKALKIAGDGAILSPWYQKIHYLLLRSDHDRLKRLFKDYEANSVEELALKEVSLLYGMHEIEHRAKSVSLTKDIRVAYDYAPVWISKEGIILGFDIDNTYDYGVATLYIPRKQSLNSLCEIIMLNSSDKDAESIKAAFSKYDIKYKYVDGLQ